MKEEIKELRLKIDGLAQLTEGVKHDHVLPKNAKEIEKAVDSLYLAKAWLGKVLGELGNENPYGSGYKTKEDIVPTADVAEMNLQAASMPFKGDDMINWSEKSHIQKVDWLRQEIQILIEEVTKWYTHTQAPSREFSIARTNTYNYLCESRFFLGFELQRIKEEK